jgi:outer membrane protein, multidrug efflux system
MSVAMAGAAFHALSKVAILSMGCTMIPEYRRPEAPIAAQYPGQREQGHAASQTGTPAAAPESAAATPAGQVQIGPQDVALTDWRSFIRDPGLRRLVDVALEGNRDLLVAVLNVEKVLAQYRIVRASLAPTVDASAGYSAARLAGITSTEWSAEFGVASYELDLFGRLRSLRAQALEEYLATEEARRAAHVLLVAQVAQQYFAWRQAQEAMRIAGQTLASVSESLRVNEAMFAAGATNEMDVRTAEGQVQSARVDLSAAQRQSAQAENAIVLLIAQPLPADLPSAQPFGDAGALAPISAGMPSQLLEQRADIVEAEHTLKAANANIGAARAAFFPRITLTGSAGVASSALSSLFRTGAWSFAPQVTVPIFDFGVNAANLEVAKVQKRIEIANYQKAIQTAFREVADALSGIETYARQVEDAAALVVTESRRLEIANARYLAGEDAYLNVLSAQKDLYTARQQLLAARGGELDNRVALYQALGGGWK